MLGHFIGTHRFLGYTGVACFLALSGYGLSRLARNAPLMAVSSWALAVLYLAFGLAALGSGGPVLALAAVVIGAAWLTRYYGKHRHRSDQ